jgi:hypothetical protein
MLCLLTVFATGFSLQNGNSKFLYAFSKIIAAEQTACLAFVSGATVGALYERGIYFI